MTGHHDVRIFRFKRWSLTFGCSLPEGWKPFASYEDGDHVAFVCRRWVRKEGS